MASPCEQSEVIKELKADSVESKIHFVNIENSIKEVVSKVSTIAERQLLVIDQTTRTNGRVTKLEQIKAAIKWILIGAVAITAIKKYGIEAIMEWFVR
jgi:threonine aldolase